MVIRDVRNEVVTVVKMKITLFLAVTPCTLIDEYLSTKFHGVTSQKAIIMIRNDHSSFKTNQPILPHIVIELPFVLHYRATKIPPEGSIANSVC
jgi:hypothetical protein